MEITIHTGFMGDINIIHVSWYNENGVRQATDIELNIQPQDKPRTLELKINGVIIAVIPNKED